MAFKVAKRGITGLETAIVLIAFVIVASVFAFAVLNMGLLSTQRASETAESGMKQAASALQLAGSISAHSSDGRYLVTSIAMYVKLSPGREPIDLSTDSLTIRFSNPRIHVDNAYDNSTKAVVAITKRTNDNGLLEAGEVAKIELNLMELVKEAITEQDKLLGEGDGSTTTFTGVLERPPIGPNTIRYLNITYQTTHPATGDPIDWREDFMDDGRGHLIRVRVVNQTSGETTWYGEEEAGTVNYASGAFTATLTQAPASGTPVKLLKADYYYTPCVLMRKERFKVEIVPSVGSALSITERAPPAISEVMVLT